MKQVGRQKQVFKLLGIGLVTGFVNGLLGAGGGILAVTLLKWAGYSAEKSHATTIAVVLPLSALSLALYLSMGRLTLSDALPYLPMGVVGAVVGATLLKRLPKRAIRLIFGGMVLYCAVRLLRG